MDDPETSAPFGVRATLRAAVGWWRPHAGLGAALVGLAILQQSFATVLAVGLKVIVDDVQGGARRLDFAEVGWALGAGFALAPRLGANVMVGRSGVFTPAITFVYSTSGAVETAQGTLLTASTSLGINLGYTVMW
jgi:hypothetical protein